MKITAMNRRPKKTAIMDMGYPPLARPVRSCRQDAREVDRVPVSRSRREGRCVELRRSKFWQRDALLPHIFARAVGIARLARLVASGERGVACPFLGMVLCGRGGGGRVLR